MAYYIIRAGEIVEKHSGNEPSPEEIVRALNKTEQLEATVKLLKSDLKDAYKRRKVR